MSIAWDGGRHHARKASASGYCYVNDAVLAIFRLLDAFERVMYIDIDIHHGDGVQDAFYLTNKVLTLSMHKWGRGFFPGGGALHDVGVGAGRGFSLNLPLKDGLRDAAFISVFEALASSAFRQFQPTVVVMQCGADGLAGDPLGDGFGLTPKAIAACVGRAVSWGAPLLLLGGGGYNSPAVARTWTAATAAALGVSLPDDIPEHQHFPAYGPDFRLFSLPCPSLRPDLNDREEVLEDCEWLLAQLRTALAEKYHSSG